MQRSNLVFLKKCTIEWSEFGINVIIYDYYKEKSCVINSALGAI